jgi:hypothetical protein
LEKIPKIAIEVFEDGYDAVWFFLWVTNEGDTLGPIGVVVAPEVIGVQEEQHSATSLITDARLLMLRRGASQQKTGLGCARRRHDHPAFALLGNRRVFDENKAENTNVEVEGLLVLSNNDSR